LTLQVSSAWKFAPKDLPRRFELSQVCWERH
jgi:hypothetical protein